VIRRVRLAHWRAYEQLDLDLTRPVTFVVAPNGVGKTSLVEAVRWAMFGRAPGVERGRAVRVGADAATVELRLDVGGATIDVTRTLGAAGRSTFGATRDGTGITEADYLRLLADAWAADVGLLPSLLFGEAGPHTSSALPVRDHLAEVFGIAPLVEATATVEGRLRAVGRDIRDLRAAGGADAAGLRRAEESVARLAADAAGAEAAVAAARAAAAEAQDAERAAAAWQQHRAALATYQARVAELGERLDAVIDVHDGEPDAQLTRAEERAADELDRRRVGVADARVRAAAAGSALDLLADGADDADGTDGTDGAAGPATCPTCLRPLSAAERASALAHHHAARGDAEGSLRAGRDAVREAEARLDLVRGISRSLRAVRVPRPPDVADPGPDAAERFAAAQHGLLDATQAHGAAVARLHDAREALTALRRSAEESAALVAAYREEAVLQVARDALGQVAERFMTERIQPLADEVARRWKLVFGSDGLRFGADGSLRLAVGGDHLGLTDLSGGERVVALFVTRLLVVASATRATTLWLDEPLEHLDPRRRAAIAGTIVRAVQQQALDQIVVTTYEERLARQLAASAPDVVAVAHVRATPPS
jgi:DNA repair exonuclease SbcCD ATPase subunit